MKVNKSPRCKHSWIRQDFLGDPVTCTWQCRISEICSGCKKFRSRPATDGEIRAELDTLLCCRCGLRKKDHRTALPGDDANDCILLLANRVTQLQERITSLEDWCNS